MKIDFGRIRKIRNKVLSVTISLLMLLALLSAGSGTVWGDAEEFADGVGSEDDPYLIENWTHLNNVREHLDAYFELSANLGETTEGYDTFSSDSANDGAGWEPIGTTEEPFTGTFDGNGKTITGLFINRPGTDYIGLFNSTGSNSVVKNVKLLDVDITGLQYLGSLAGYNSGEITNCSAVGIVSGGSLFSGADSGGLVGENDGSITGSHATGTVNVRGMAAGGLAGDNNGTITDCYAEGTVSCKGSQVGGLVGWSTFGSSIANSYAAVDVNGSEDVGGLVGSNTGSITGSHATGTVKASRPNAGGLVGYSSGNLIASSYATGAVTGTSCVGGLVGYDYCDTINSYATGAVTGTSNNVGGLVGYNNNSIIENTYAVGKVTGKSYVGGLVGRNSDGVITSSYYNRQTTGKDDDIGKGVPKTSAEMVQKAAFTAGNWNFNAGSGIWMISEGASYPYLRELTPASLPAPPAITGVTVTPAALSLTYGAGPVALTAVVAPDGALYEIFWSSSDEDVASVNEKSVMTPVGYGTATIFAATAAGGITGSTTVTVNKKTLTVEGTLTVNSKTYDGTTAAAINEAGLTLLGIIAGDAGQVTLNAAAAFEDARASTDKTVSLTAASALAGTKEGNYALSLASAPTASAIISPKAITITADGKSKTVGEADPVLTYQITEGELIGGDTVTGTLSRTVGEAAGSYAIEIGTLDAGLNYVITFHEAPFTISAVPSDSGHRKRPVSNPSIPDSFTFEIPKDFRVSNDGSDMVNFECSIADITVPRDMFLSIPEDENKKAEIVISRGDKSSLPENIRADIGDKPLIGLSLLLDGDQTDWSNPDAPLTISVPYMPTQEELEHAESIVVWYIDGAGNVQTVPNGRYDAASGKVTFNVTHFSDYAVAYHPVSFSDVPTGAWYSNAVGFIAARVITTGTGGGKFSPKVKLTRSQFLVMLMKACEIAPDARTQENFADAGNTYYTGYLAAAKRLGISGGVGDSLFAPTRAITRQEMFTLLCNALKVIGQPPEVNDRNPGGRIVGKSLSDFVDARQVAPWAKEAMTLLVETGTIDGNSGKLTPTGTATRAEMAQVLYNLLGK